MNELDLLDEEIKATQDEIKYMSAQLTLGKQIYQRSVIELTNLLKRKATYAVTGTKDGKVLDFRPRVDVTRSTHEKGAP